jgi:dCTP deaminase
MVLTGPEICKQIEKGTIKIDPFDRQWVGPNSVDLHLGETLLVYSLSRKPVHGVGGTIHYPIDSKSPPSTVEVERCDNGGWVLEPGRLYLGVTREYTETFGFVPYIDGRSSFGRLGVFTHICAGRGDDGFKGYWTLELSVVEPVIVYPGGRYFQITYHQVVGDRQPYSSKRYDQRDPMPVASRIHHSTSHD